MKKRFLALLMIITLVLSGTSAVYAAEAETQMCQAENQTQKQQMKQGVAVSGINPIYESEIEIDELEQLEQMPVAYSYTTVSEEEYTSDTSKITADFRDKMLNRDASMVFYYRTNDFENTKEWMRNLFFEWFYAACEETDNPRAGDFLQYSVSAYGISCSYFESGADTCVKVTINLKYYSSKAQEDVLTTHINSVLKQLNVENLPSEFEKVKAIYDYICENVTYDYENLYDENYLLKFSAYAAMVNKTAVCQGYATLFYAMAEQSGLDARVITGTSGGVNHAWNIVKIGDYYYYLDSTWDAGQDEYAYFLKCEKNFTGHDIGEEFITEEFRNKYPIGTEDYNLCTNHTEVADPAVAATCTVNGWTAGSHCSKCGVHIIVPTVIPATGHTVVEDLPVAATCMRAGLTKGSHCSACGTVLEAQQTIPKTGHDYVQTAQDGSITVYKYVCQHCSDMYSEVVDSYRVYGSNRYHTSFAIADAMKADIGIQKYGSVIIASGTGFPDALAGSYLASIVGAPIIMANPSGANADELRDYISENLLQDGVIYILGGAGAVPECVENTLLNEGYTVKRLSGRDRYTTNIRILEEAIDRGGDLSELLVCTGNNFADSLSASVTGMPILLVNDKTGNLTGEQIKFLNKENAQIQDCYVIGGTGAVPESLLNAMKRYGATTRIKGKNRYETSVKIAETFMPEAEKVILASGENFPDGLCGGPLGHNLRAALILTKSGSEAYAANYVTDNQIKVGVILGGTGAVTSKTELKILGKELAEKKYYKK